MNRTSSVWACCHLDTWSFHQYAGQIEQPLDVKVQHNVNQICMIIKSILRSYVQQWWTVAAHIAVIFLRWQYVWALLWPPKSPDMSPSEQIWDVLDHQHTPVLQQLGLALWEEWRPIPREIMQSIIASMPRPRGYKTFSMLNSAEHEIYPAHKC